MEIESEQRGGLIVMPEFLISASEFPKEEGRKIVEAIELMMRNPDDPSLSRERLEGKAAGLQSIRATDSCRIVFAGRQVIMLRYVGTGEQAHRFAERAAAEVTAMAESPIAHQLHACADPLQVFAATLVSESPSCGAPISIGTLARLILRTRKYLPLTRLLLSRGPEIGAMEMRFQAIETALAGTLPKSARRSRTWWANDPGRSQAYSWMAIGWETVSVDLQAETVDFVRSRGSAENIR